MLQRPQRIADGAGGAAIVYQDISYLWVRISARGGGERAFAGQRAGERRMRAVLRFTGDLQPADRLRWGSRTFSIDLIHDPDGRREWLELDLTELEGTP